ncbi:hypothetical protein KUTeg_002263 [Tegillarca granosa]|uniref:Ig-like domain-containing protein n=1 Tax=Tegillarca granosa TaxID=220873 RepID=A0ABQ9FTU2_TEGGR|nr:hypothetical protein KUTeg_002263 [Tegillarca granosa]
MHKIYLSPRPTPQEHEVEEILEESPIEKTTVKKEESRYDFDTRLSSFERVHDSHIPLPDFNQEDFEFSTNEIDPDLLSMNLAPILEEDEEGYEEEENNNATPRDRSWKENWIFKGASNISPYDNLGKKRVGSELGEMYMMVPNPEKDYSPQVGNRDADQLSDLSETEDKDDENLSDEESSFYSKTSEELARITRKSSATQSSAHTLASSSVQTEESELDTSKDCASSVSESGVKGQGLTSEKSDSSADESSVNKTLVEELVPAEGDDPKFEIPPESVTVAEGEPVKFYCRVGGTTPVDIFWYKVSPSHELQELEDSEQFDLLREGNRYTITMYNPTKSDAGQYMCMAINGKGQCCQYIILTVKKNTQELKKPEFLKEIKDLEVREGQSVKFRCKVKGYPQPRIVWYKDRKKLKSDHNVKIEKFGNRDYILTIDCATMDEDAEYSVVAKNIAGEVKSVAQLIVEPDQSDEVVQTKSPLISNSILMKKESPALHKDDQQLSNLGKKMFMTKDSVTEMAEDMLHTADELSDLHKSLDEMDTMLSSFEQDINTTNSKTWTDSVLSHNLDSNTIQNHKNMRHAAENVRHATTAALNIITSTENVIGSDKQEMDCLATSTPRCSEDGDTTKSDDHENNNYLLKTSGELNYSVNSDNSDTEALVQRTEFVIAPSSSGNQIKSVHNNDLSVDVSDNSLHRQDNSKSVIDNKSTPESMDHSNMSDINSNTHKRQRWKWDINSASYPPPNDFSQEKELENAEDQIYLAAGKVFALEDRVQDLHKEVTSNSEKRKISDLEDEVARTVAQVHQSEKDVSTIERTVGQLHVSAPTSPRSSMWEDNSSNLSSPSLSVDSGFSSIRERPLQTVIVGTTSEEDMPESRTEVNEETGVELPSVSRLKAMFSHSKPQDDDGSLKRVSFC